MASSPSVWSDEESSDLVPKLKSALIQSAVKAKSYQTKNYSTDKNNNRQTKNTTMSLHSGSSSTKPLSQFQQVSQKIQELLTGDNSLESMHQKSVSDKHDIQDDLNTANIHIEALHFQLKEVKEKHKLHNNRNSEKTANLEDMVESLNHTVGLLQNEKLELEFKLENSTPESGKYTGWFCKNVIKMAKMTPFDPKMT